MGGIAENKGAAAEEAKTSGRVEREGVWYGTGLYDSALGKLICV